MNNPVEAVAAYPQFRFIEFNPRRAQRGKESARVEVRHSSEPDDHEWLWMSTEDIRGNLRDFGESEELRKALAAYA